ncbi:hypothetical protein [Clostridium thermarum]|nr:hypothetical protein [Clostridium thermarum]
MIKPLNTNINVNESFEERLAVELEERQEMSLWGCDCNGFTCTSTNNAKG